MNVIGLTGLPGAGKTTVANYLMRAHGYTKLSFAQPAKNMLLELDPLLGASRLSQVVEHAVWKVDNGWQGTVESYIASTQWSREYNRLLETLITLHTPEFWVDAAKALMTNDNGKYVFDDVTLPAQAQLITEENPWGLWEVQRSDLDPAGPVIELGEWQTIFNIPDYMKHLETSVDTALGLAFSDTAPLAA
jgi:hypothetical protein